MSTSFRVIVIIHYSHLESDPEHFLMFLNISCLNIAIAFNFFQKLTEPNDFETIP